jgi:hypothetical protein
MFALKNWLKSSRQPSTAARSRPARFRPELEKLEERRVMDVGFHGGPVIPHVHVDPIFYGQTWSGSDYQRSANLASFVSTITKSSYLSALGEYGVGTGSSDNAVYKTDSSSPAYGTTITESQIQSLLKSEIDSGQVASPDGSHVYAVFLPTNVTSQLDNIQVFAAHHNSFSYLQTHWQYAPGLGTWVMWQSYATVPYIVVPTPGGTNWLAGGPAGSLGTFDQTTSVFTHELAETVTNPFISVAPTPNWYYLPAPGGGYKFTAIYTTISNGTGWFDAKGNEIGDLVNGQYAYLDGYAVQKEWSNAWERGVVAAYDSTWLGTNPWGYWTAGYNTTGQISSPFYNQATGQNVARTEYVSWGKLGVYYDWSIGSNDYSGWVAYAF